MKRAANVVIAEDEPFVQELLAAHVRAAGFQPSPVSTGSELLALLDSSLVDLVLLDLGLPDEDGLVLMRQIRARSSVPVVVLTARQEREDRISALELGADDYLTKPCDPDELVLRIKNLLARSSAGADSARKKSHKLEFEGWVLNLDARSVVNEDGAELALSRAEFNLLAALVHAPNRVLSRGQLLDAVSRNDSSPSERMVDVLVARLRRKLESNPRKPKMIKTMVGMGYRFSARVTAV